MCSTDCRRVSRLMLDMVDVMQCAVTASRLFLSRCRLTDSVVLEEGGRSGATVSAAESKELEEFEAVASEPIFMSAAAITPAGVLSRVRNPHQTPSTHSTILSKRKALQYCGTL